MGILEGKDILVTGVTMRTSIAYAAVEIAQREGANVVVSAAGRAVAPATRAISKLDPVPPIVEVDVTNPEHLAALPGLLSEHFDGGLDGTPDAHPDDVTPLPIGVTRATGDDDVLLEADGDLQKLLARLVLRQEIAIARRASSCATRPTWRGASPPCRSGW